MGDIKIAIDGPAASGKSTTASRVARALGYSHLNSGLLYRAITWVAAAQGWPGDEPGFDDRLEAVDLDLERVGAGFRVRVDGVDPGLNLVSPATSSMVSEVSARPAVRERVLRLLQAEGGRGGIVCDGRDIGTVVFPDAELKVFLVASAEERGKRRLLEHGEEPTAEAVREEAERLLKRDALDAGRPIAPLRRADDAIQLDTTRMSASDVVERIVSLARNRISSLS